MSKYNHLECYEIDTLIKGLCEATIDCIKREVEVPEWVYPKLEELNARRAQAYTERRNRIDNQTKGV